MEHSQRSCWTDNHLDECQDDYLSGSCGVNSAFHKGMLWFLMFDPVKTLKVLMCDGHHRVRMDEKT